MLSIKRNYVFPPVNYTEKKKKKNEKDKQFLQIYVTFVVKPTLNKKGARI